MMWFSVEYLIENGIMDDYFPYPLAFCSACNMWLFLVLLVFAIIIFLLFKMVLRWLMSSLG